MWRPVFPPDAQRTEKFLALVGVVTNKSKALFFVGQKTNEGGNARSLTRWAHAIYTFTGTETLQVFTNPESGCA